MHHHMYSIILLTHVRITLSSMVTFKINDYYYVQL